MWLATATATASAIVIVIALGAGGGAARADFTDEYTQAYSWYVDRGVAPETAEQLADEITHGRLPMSADSREAPTKVVTVRDGEWVVTTRTYADGSIAEARVESPTPTLSPSKAAAIRYGAESGGAQLLSVGSCEAYSSGSGYVSYTGCRAEEATASVVMSFRADYWRASSGSGGITAVRTPYVWVSGGTAATPTLTINKSSGNASSPAKATGTTVFNTAYSSGQISLFLYVTGSSAWTGKSGF